MVTQGQKFPIDQIPPFLFPQPSFVFRPNTLLLLSVHSATASFSTNLYVFLFEGLTATPLNTWLAKNSPDAHIPWRLFPNILVVSEALIIDQTITFVTWKHYGLRMLTKAVNCFSWNFMFCDLTKIVLKRSFDF